MTSDKPFALLESPLAHLEQAGHHGTHAIEGKGKEVAFLRNSNSWTWALVLPFSSRVTQDG